MKKVWLGFIVVFVVFLILDYITNSLILASTYQSPQLEGVWRPEAEMKLWLFPINTLIFSFFFSLVFSKGWEGKGIGEGFRYGLYIGLMMTIPMAYGQYAVYPIPYYLALQWFIYGMIEFFIAGIVLALIFGKKTQEATA